MAPKESSQRVRFGTFEVDFRAGELRKQGRKIKLQDRPFQFLALLLERPGQLVPREELVRRLWSENALIDVANGLNTAAKKLRQALGDDAETPRFIETVPRHGYRFKALPLRISEPQWSPDGQRIAFTGGHANSELISVYVVPVNGGSVEAAPTEPREAGSPSCRPTASL